MDKETSDAIDRLIATAPPLSDQTKAKLAALLNPPGYVPPGDGGEVP
jgi:hypothetical protein